MSKALLVRSIVAVLGLVAALPAAASDLGWHGLEVRGGALFPSDYDSGLTFALAADLGELTDGLRLLAGITYSEADDTETVRVQGLPFEVDSEISSIAVGAEVRWFPSRGEEGFFLGAGPYFHTQDSEDVLVVGNLTVRSDVEDEEIGIQGVLGYSFARRFDVQVRYDTVSNLEGVQLMVGLRFGK